jgi:hypothetical protein
MKKVPVKTPTEIILEKLERLKEKNATVKITTSDDPPYHVIVGKIIKLEKNWVTLRKVPKLSDGKFPATFTGDTFSFNYALERDTDVTSV